MSEKDNRTILEKMKLMEKNISEYICGCHHDDCDFSPYEGMWKKLKEWLDDKK